MSEFDHASSPLNPEDARFLSGLYLDRPDYNDPEQVFTDDDAETYLTINQDRIALESSIQDPPFDADLGMRDRIRDPKTGWTQYDFRFMGRNGINSVVDMTDVMPSGQPYTVEDRPMDLNAMYRAAASYEQSKNTDASDVWGH